MDRIARLKLKAFKESNFDGYVVFNEVNLTYFTGISGASALLIPEDGQSILFVYGTNYEMCKAQGEGLAVEFVKSGENLMDKIAGQAKIFGMKQLAVDALNLEEWQSLAKSVGDEKKLACASNFVRDLRMVKDKSEIELMRKAGELASLGVRVAYETVEPGISERAVAAEIEYAMRKHGSDGTCFDTIVASGANSAYPHGGCSDKKICDGDLVVVDLGAKYRMYHSDLTRTLVAGKPSEKQKKLHRIVLEAYEKAFDAIKPGVKACDVDAVGRRVVEDAGYGEFFVHGLGHGVGLEIHEPPTLSRSGKEVLVTGNVVTNEPGIYLIGYGGVRVEDTVLITKTGGEKLTKGPCGLGR